MIQFLLAALLPYSSHTSEPKLGHMGKPALATTAVRGVYSSQDSVTTSCPCPHLSKVPCSSCEGASSRPLTKVLGILQMPLLLTRCFVGLQPSAFHSQDN